MRREDLEHVIRAAAAVTGDRDVVVIGSQAILGRYPDAPVELRGSVDADVYPRSAPDRADLVDGAIGEGSLFADTFGYHGHGVGPTTATLPPGWDGRLVPVRNENTGGATGWCLEPHDLVAAKLAAGREKDIEFASVALRHGLVQEAVVAARIDELARPAADAARRALAVAVSRSAAPRGGTA